MRFDAKFIGMRKEQDFIIYPLDRSNDAATILCQSDSRWLEIDTKTGECWITSAQSGHHNRWMLAMQKAQGKAKQFTLSPVELSELKMHVFTTADKNAGNSVITTDNSGAFNVI